MDRSGGILLLHGVALRTIRYNERHDIVWLYTREAGRVSVLVSAGKGHRSSAIRAALQPLSVVEVVARKGGGILRATDVRPSAVLHSLQCDPTKIVLSIFIAEFLSVTLPEGEADARLFGFVEDVVDCLEDHRHSVANYHIAFLFGLASPLGIAPDISTYMPGRIFDMSDASFRDSVPLHTPDWLPADQSEMLVILSRISLRNCHRFAFSREQRSFVLDKLLRYYTLHYRSLSTLRSLAVLRSLYD